MVQRGLHFGNLRGGWLVLAVHICKVLQPGRPRPESFLLKLAILWVPLTNIVQALPSHMIWTPGNNLRDDTRAMDDPDSSACAWCILLTPLGCTPTWVLVLSCSPLQAWRDCTGSHTASLDAVRVKYILYFCNLVSLIYGKDYCVPGHAMSCTLQSLPSKKSEMRWQSSRLYSQRAPPFWRAMAGCLAIRPLNATTEPLVRFYSTARTNGHV